MHDPTQMPSVPALNADDILKAVPPEFANEAYLADLPSSPIPPPPGEDHWSET
jgi:hypothetical protein